MGNTATVTDVATARKRLKAREISLSICANRCRRPARDLLVNYFQDYRCVAVRRIGEADFAAAAAGCRQGDSDHGSHQNDGKLSSLGLGVNYLLKLPPEYQHTRSYPLLIVLPNGGQKPADMLKKLGDMPAKYGFIVAVVDWATGFGTAYNYTEDEQTLVTGTLRHLRRTLQVDSDRVFVFGDGEGANFALDLGATHPDLFAGIIPMNPRPICNTTTSFRCWKNFQNLPVYLIVGDRAGDAIKTIRDILTNWTKSGYPGFGGVVQGPRLRMVRRRIPLCLRLDEPENPRQHFPRFGRISHHSRRQQSLLLDQHRRDRQELSSSIRRKGISNSSPPRSKRTFSGNVITVEVMRMKQISIWLGKGTADFTKPISVSIKGHGNAWTKSLTPKIDVLLEDLYERGDRQRPFYQRIDCNLSAFLPKFSAQ